MDLQSIIREAREDCGLPGDLYYVQSICLQKVMVQSDPDLYTRFWDEWKRDTEWFEAREIAWREMQEREQEHWEARIAEAVRQSHLTPEEQEAELYAAAKELGIDLSPGSLKRK